MSQHSSSSSSSTNPSSEIGNGSPTSLFHLLEGRTTRESNEETMAITGRNHNNDSEGQYDPLSTPQAVPPMLDAILVAAKYEEEAVNDCEYEREITERISSLVLSLEAWSMGSQAILSSRYEMIEKKMKAIQEKQAAQGPFSNPTSFSTASPWALQNIQGNKFKRP
ncbi:hypothetical protein FRC14_001761 [Serendipita sp. 396]|nr:hypothetical protein FRC14_001761 [Serendipita sp. 396]